MKFYFRQVGFIVHFNANLHSVLFRVWFTIKSTDWFGSFHPVTTLIALVFNTLMDSFFEGFWTFVFMWLHNRTDNMNIFYFHGPLSCGTWKQFFLVFYTGYRSIRHLHGKILYGNEICSFLRIDSHTDHLNILHFHGLLLCGLLKMLPYYLVNHTDYIIIVHPLRSLLYL